MKQLKNYLHLYLGCDTNKGKLCSVNIEGICIVMMNDGQIEAGNIEDIKPILRPLSDMTEEEREEFKNVRYGHRLLDISLFIDLELSATYVKWLLSKHFDLFGLVEAGLAINATTLTETMQ